MNEASKEPNKEGNFLLHLALAERDCSPAKLSLLAEFDPEALWQTNKEGKRWLLLSLLCLSFPSLSGEAN